MSVYSAVSGVCYPPGNPPGDNSGKEMYANFFWLRQKYRGYNMEALLLIKVVLCVTASLRWWLIERISFVAAGRSVKCTTVTGYIYLISQQKSPLDWAIIYMCKAWLKEVLQWFPNYLQKPKKVMFAFRVKLQKLYIVQVDTMFYWAVLKRNTCKTLDKNL